MKKDLLGEIERQLCQANHIYGYSRKAGRLAPLISVLVRSGTFSVFLNKILVTDDVSPIQVKPHRLLKNEEHIKFFYDNQIDTNSFFIILTYIFMVTRPMKTIMNDEHFS